jgi:hypothetical protein
LALCALESYDALLKTKYQSSSSLPSAAQLLEGKEGREGGRAGGREEGRERSV